MAIPRVQVDIHFHNPNSLPNWHSYYWSSCRRLEAADANSCAEFDHEHKTAGGNLVGKSSLMKNFKQQLLRPLFLGVINLLSSNIRDVDTGEYIGRALLIPWRGRILILGKGVAGYALVPKFCAQTRLTFWKCELGFTQHPPPDYPSESRS